MDLTRNQNDTNNILNSAKKAKENIEKERNFTNEFKKGLKNEIDKTLIDIKSNRSDFRSFIDWAADKNYFGFCKENERDPKKIGWTADEGANRLTMDVFGGIGAISLGACLMTFCPILAIFIIAEGVVPTPIKEAIRKELQEDTLNIIPFEEIPSIAEKMSKKAGKIRGDVDQRIKTFAQIMGNTIKEEKKNETRKNNNKSWQNKVNKEKKQESLINLPTK